MPPQVLHKVLSDTPFRSFRLHVSDGTSYDILNPADAYATPLYVCVGTDLDEPSGLFTLSLYVSPNHVTRLQFLPTSPSGQVR